MRGGLKRTHKLFCWLNATKWPAVDPAGAGTANPVLHHAYPSIFSTLESLIRGAAMLVWPPDSTVQSASYLPSFFNVATEVASP